MTSSLDRKLNLIDRERKGRCLWEQTVNAETKNPKVVEIPVPHGTGHRAAPFSRVHNIHSDTVPDDNPGLSICEERILQQAIGLELGSWASLMQAIKCYFASLNR